MLPHKQERRPLERCPPLRRIRLAVDDPDTVGTAGRERRFRGHCHLRRQHSRRSSAVHRAERCLGRRAAKCSGVRWHSTCRPWCPRGRLRDCAREIALSTGISSARWYCAGCMASCGTTTSRCASPCVAHWPGCGQLERRTQWMERSPAASPAQEDASSMRPSRFPSLMTPELSANEKGSPRCKAHCTGKPDRLDDASARSRFACRAATETARSGSGRRQ